MREGDLIERSNLSLPVQKEKDALQKEMGANLAAKDEEIQRLRQALGAQGEMEAQVAAKDAELQRLRQALRVQEQMEAMLAAKDLEIQCLLRKSGKMEQTGGWEREEMKVISSLESSEGQIEK